MPSHFTRLSFSSRNESPAEHPHSWELPLQFDPAGSQHDEVKIPDPENFKEVSIPLNSSSFAHFCIADITDVDILYPLPCHLATHLCLLECFHKLKREVMHSEHLDAIFQLPPEYDFKSCDTPIAEDPKGKKTLLIEEPESTNATRRWELFVKLAVDRLDIWWRNIDKIVRHAAMYTNHSSGRRITELEKEYLPPLDVLLVWYSYMLQPAYYDDCVNFEKMTGFALPLPWKAINEVIDQRALTYNLPTAAENLFKTVSSQPADLLSYLTSPPPYAESADQPYSVDLEQAVHMQEPFIDEAHRLLLLRSPALRGSLRRSIEQYKRYIFLIHSYPNQQTKLTPTWDIDLAWRTHRLYPENYYNSITLKLDQPPPPFNAPEPGKQKEVAAEKQEQATNPLSQLWQLHFKEEPHSCLCWTCETIKDMGFKEPQSLSRKQQKEAQELLGFHTAVERSREAGLRLPDPLPQMVKKPKKEEKVEIHPGAGYYEKIIPAKYDKHGNMVKPEERKLKREKAFTVAYNYWLGV